MACGSHWANYPILGNGNGLKCGSADCRAASNNVEQF